MRKNIQSAKALDLTHPMVFSSPDGAKNAPPVLIVNPDSTLHHRSALAWVIAYETLVLMEAAQMGFGSDPKGDAAVMNMAVERVRNLTVLLDDISGRTAELDGGTS